MKKIYLALAVFSAVAIVIGSTVLSVSYEPLDEVAERMNLTGESLLGSPFPEYTIPGFPGWAGGIISGLVGGITVFAIIRLLMKVGEDGGN
ncbi:MAG: PDGLE domain-containing protein [Desulfurococcales archaeon]|jgi:hypothetical protein|uniref:Cobalamin biosynthesis protein n=1 Tax=Fervidicoccus fontis TaxID=683846 RepID=A0A7J3SNF8_9CREN